MGCIYIYIYGVYIYIDSIYFGLKVFITLAVLALT